MTYVPVPFATLGIIVSGLVLRGHTGPGATPPLRLVAEPISSVRMSNISQNTKLLPLPASEHAVRSSAPKRNLISGLRAWSAQGSRSCSRSRKRASGMLIGAVRRSFAQRSLRVPGPLRWSGVRQPDDNFPRPRRPLKAGTTGCEGTVGRYGSIRLERL
jgi:hypothetical protein